MVSCIIYYIRHTYTGVNAENKQGDLILVLLLSEHCFSYLAAFYRAWDIDLNGTMDINGIKRAPRESLLGNFQFFIGCVILGFSIKHLSRSETRQNFINNDYVMQNYWTIIDLMIVFLI